MSYILLVPIYLAWVCKFIGKQLYVAFSNFEFKKKEDILVMSIRYLTPEAKKILPLKFYNFQVILSYKKKTSFNFYFEIVKKVEV